MIHTWNSMFSFGSRSEIVVAIVTNIAYYFLSTQCTRKDVSNLLEINLWLTLSTPNTNMFPGLYHKSALLSYSSFVIGVPESTIRISP
jgi:hypothetical protein